MATKTFNFNLFLTPFGTRDDPHYNMTDTDMTSHGYILIEKVPITVELPDARALTEQRVRALDQAEKTLRAEFAARITELQRQKNELLAIENTVEA